MGDFCAQTKKTTWMCLSFNLVDKKDKSLILWWRRRSEAGISNHLLTEKEKQKVQKKDVKSALTLPNKQ